MSISPSLTGCQIVKKTVVWLDTEKPTRAKYALRNPATCPAGGLGRGILSSLLNHRQNWSSIYRAISENDHVLGRENK